MFDSYENKSWFPYSGPAAFEIKSLPGAWREKLSVLMRNDTFDVKSPLPYQLRLWTAAEVMRDVHPTLLKAERSLLKKTPSQYSRNVFLITHPFDHFALDVAQSVAVSPLMPRKVVYDALDSIWSSGHPTSSSCGLGRLAPGPTYFSLPILRSPVPTLRFRLFKMSSLRT